MTIYVQRKTAAIDPKTGNSTEVTYLLFWLVFQNCKITKYVNWLGNFKPEIIWTFCNGSNYMHNANKIEHYTVIYFKLLIISNGVVNISRQREKTVVLLRRELRASLLIHSNLNFFLFQSRNKYFFIYIHIHQVWFPPAVMEQL